MKINCSKLLSIVFILFANHLNAQDQNRLKNLTDSLVLAYDFNNDAGFMAKEQVSGTLGEARFGAAFKQGGLYLDGTDDELKHPKSENTRLAGNEITVTAWLKADGTDSINAVISKFYAYELKVVNGFLEFKLTLDGFKSFEAKTKTAVIKQNQLHHIVAIRKSDSIAFFIDGDKKKTTYKNTRLTNNLYPANNDIYIGSANNKEWFDGIIYNVSIYKRALTKSDVDMLISKQDIPNQKPKVDAGPNLYFIQNGFNIPLKGYANDFHGEIVNTKWEQTSGKVLQLSKDTIQKVGEGEYAFRFTAFDNDGDSTSSEMRIICYGLSEAVSFVSPQGNDSLGNGTKEHPFRTIKKALEAYPGGYHQTIHMLPGVYKPDKKIVITDGVSLLGSGVKHTTIIPDKKLYSHIRDIDSSLILIKNVKKYGRYGFFSIDGCEKQLNVAMAAKNVNNIEISHLNIEDTYFSGIGLVDISNANIHHIRLENTSWGDAGYSAGAMVIGDAEKVDIHNIDISEGLINKPNSWGYGIKAYSIEGSSYLKKLRIFDAVIETNNKGFWNNGEAPNIAIEFHNTSFDSCEIFNAEVNNTISLVPNQITPGSKNIRLHHNHIHSPGGVPIESYMMNCEIDHNYIIGEYTTIKGFNNNRYEDYLVHHNVFTDQYPKTGHSQALSYGALKNLQFYNNTCYFTRLDNVTGIEFFSGQSENVEVLNNIFYSETYSDDAKVLGLKNGAEVSNVTVSNNVLYNYNIGVQPDVEENNYFKNPNLVWDKTLSYWLPMASDTSWLIDQGIDVGLPFEGENPDIGAGEGTAGKLNAPEIIIHTPYNNYPILLNDSLRLLASAVDQTGIANFRIWLNDSLITNNAQSAIDKQLKMTQPGKVNFRFQAINNEGIIAAKTIHLNVSVGIDSIDIVQEDVIQLKVGQDTMLNYLAYPEEATNKNVYWSSSDKNIAYIDIKGNLNAISEGEAIITIVSADGKKQAQVNVEVKGYLDIRGFEPPLGKLMIFPNPAQGNTFYLQSQSIKALGEYGVKIYSITGKVLFNKTLYAQADNVIVVNMQQPYLRNNSMVLVVLTNEMGKIYSQKLIVK